MSVEEGSVPASRRHGMRYCRTILFSEWSVKRVKKGETNLLDSLLIVGRFSVAIGESILKFGLCFAVLLSQEGQDADIVFECYPLCPREALKGRQVGCIQSTKDVATEWQ
jgi:hypothetical protein